MRRRLFGTAIVLTLLSLLADPAAAHVRYVTDGEGVRGSILFLLSVLTQPMNAALFAGGGIVSAVAAVGYVRYRPFRAETDVVVRTLRSYKPYLPWLLRLSLGLPLVGAGFTGYLFSPAVPTSIRLVQVSLGFVLLFGLFTRVAAAIGLLAYLVTLVVHWPVPLLAVEYAPGFLAIVALGSGQPSADGVFRRLVVTEGTVFNRLHGVHDLGKRLTSRVGLTHDKVGLILRLGLGVSFVYLGLTQKLMQPEIAVEVVYKYSLTSVVPVAPMMWVAGAGIAEMIVGGFLIAGLFTRGTAGIAFLLFTSTLFALPDDPVLAHVSLFGLVSALMITGSGPYSLSPVVEALLGRPETPPDEESEYTVA